MSVRAARAEPAPSGAGSVSAAGAPGSAGQSFPRLKLSYRNFAISNLDFTPVQLQGAELDAYPLSTQWVRGGFEVEGGAGSATLNGLDVAVRYGLIGLGVGLQYAAPVTPFVDGRIVGGILSGDLDGSLAMAAATSTKPSPVGASATTWIYGRGIDAGAEMFLGGRAYLSIAIGWLHTTWRGVDYAALMQNPSAPLRSKDIDGDSFTFKIGLGI
jgi:hypothetical protein